MKLLSVTERPKHPVKKLDAKHKVLYLIRHGQVCYKFIFDPLDLHDDASAINSSRWRTFEKAGQLKNQNLSEMQNCRILVLVRLKRSRMSSQALTRNSALFPLFGEQSRLHAMLSRRKISIWFLVRWSQNSLLEFVIYLALVS
jgi:hypothetical protein